MKVPCALTIAGSDSGGGAGIACDIKTFAALGVHGLCVVTAVTAQNTKGIRGISELPLEFISKQLDAVMQDFEVEWAKTGMLWSSPIIKTIDAGIELYDLRAVIDPVMISSTGEPLLKEEAHEALLRLLKRAELVTPNIYEAEKLSGVRIKSIADLRKAAREIARLGPQAVLIKGGHLRGKELVDLLYVGGKFVELKGPRVPTEPMHGIGCSFSAAITAELSKGSGVKEAVLGAKDFISYTIKGRLEIGKGLKPINPMAKLLLDAEKSQVFEEVWRAAKLLASEPKFAELLPEVGSNLAMALPGAKQTSEVFGLSERIIRARGRPRLRGFPALGASEHVANVVLTAMSYDPKIRAGINVKFSDEILRACRQLGLSIAGFDRAKEPPKVKTMVWGTRQAIKKAGRVPDVIFDSGAPGKEPMVRILGRSSFEVADLVLRIAKELGGESLTHKMS